MNRLLPDTPVQKLTEQEYLKSEPYSEIRHEYIDGYAYEMADSKFSHHYIKSNLLMTIGNSLELKRAYHVFASGFRVKVGSNYFYPDIVVDCSNLSGDSIFTENPTAIVEIIAKATRKTDKVIKRYAYTSIPTLKEYMLVEQDFVEVEFWRRHGQHWELSVYYLGDSITFDSISLTLTVEEIYDRVDNEEMTEWLIQKAREAAEADVAQATSTLTDSE